MAKAKPAKKASKTKVKPIAKASKPAAKGIKTIKSAAPAKKANKKLIKKPDVKAKKIEPVKPAKIPSDSKKEKDTKKIPVEPVKKAVEPKNNAKVQAKPSKTKTKSKKPEKKSEEDFDDDIIGDDFGESEIAEYEEDLKAVEEDDDDSLLEIGDDDDTEVKDEEIYLTDSEGRRLCRVRDCDQVSTVEGYCRYHYLLLWKKIQIRKHILIDGKLEKYVEDLMARYPDKFLEVIKKDLKTEKDFISVIQEMEIDESALAENDNEDEVQSFADEIRGIGEAPAMDDDGDF